MQCSGEHDIVFEFDGDFFSDEGFEEGEKDLYSSGKDEKRVKKERDIQALNKNNSILAILSIGEYFFNNNGLNLHARPSFVVLWWGSAQPSGRRDGFPLIVEKATNLRHKSVKNTKATFYTQNSGVCNGG